VLSLEGHKRTRTLMLRPIVFFEESKTEVCAT
jgi:hypothetical protein